MAASNEGKTSLTSSMVCDWCLEDQGDLFCGECTMTLCNKCTAIHKRVPATKGHTLQTVDDKGPHIGTASDDEGIDIHCEQHPSTLVSAICELCIELVCTSCDNHGSHKIIPLTSDIHMLQQLNVGSLQEIVTEYQDLGKQKKVLQDHVTIFEKAIGAVEEARSNVVKEANDLADALCESIKKEKTNLESKRSGPFQSVNERMAKSDEQISKLHQLKSNMNRFVLIRGIHDSSIARNLNKEFLQSNNTKYKNSSIETILPGISTKNEVKMLLKSLFSRNLCHDEDEHDKVDLATYTLRDQVELGGDKWGICDSYHNGTITVFSLFDSEIISFKNLPSLNTKQKYEINAGLYHMVKVSDKRYVSSCDGVLYLLDDMYKIIDKKLRLSLLDGFTNSICSDSEGGIIECQLSSDKIHIFSIKVQGDNFVSSEIKTFVVNTYPGYYQALHVRTKGDNIVIAQIGEVYVYNRKTLQLLTYDLSDYISDDIWSLSLAVPQNILVGDQKGVHVFDKEMKHICHIDAGGLVRGIHYEDGSLYLTVKKSNCVLQIYS